MSEPMTVADLISKLKNYPNGALVVCSESHTNSLIFDDSFHYFSEGDTKVDSLREYFLDIDDYLAILSIDV